MNNSTNEHLLAMRGNPGGSSGAPPQRHSSPQPRSNKRSMDSGRQSSAKQQTASTGGAQLLRPPSRRKSNSALLEHEKAELAHAVLSSMTVKRPAPPKDGSLPPKANGYGRRHDGRGKNAARYVPPRHVDLALNRFKLILSPSSPIGSMQMVDVLRLSSADLWPHTVAVIAYDQDPLCPICLDHVRVGRAIRCGHVFCGVCLQRCLNAAVSEPLLQKCPVCAEGTLLEKEVRRCDIRHNDEKSDVFSLVLGVPMDEMPPFLEKDVSCRIVVATGEAMMRLIEKERSETAEYRADLKRFRDAEGLALLQESSKDLDAAHVEWQRQVGRPRREARTVHLHPNSTDWTYQRADGSLEFLHPVNLRCLLKNCLGDATLLPPIIKPEEILEVEEWSDKKFASVVKLGAAHLPENPISVQIVEVRLGGMSSEAAEAVEKETKDRARRRHDRETRLLKEQIRTMEMESAAEERRRREREEEEALLLAFFGYEERKAEDAKREALMEKPQPAVGSFSAVVSSMGYFPALTKSPTLSSSKSASNKPTTPQMEPLRSAWGVSHSPHALSLGSSPPSSSPSPLNGEAQQNFAKAAAQGPQGKKMLWSNNPTRRI